MSKSRFRRAFLDKAKEMANDEEAMEAFSKVDEEEEAKKNAK